LLSLRQVTPREDARGIVVRKPFVALDDPCFLN